MVAQHTPGPWIAKMAVTGSGDFGILTTKGDVLAEVFSDIRSHGERCPEVVYNARLIAAAPDLLEALQELIGCPYDIDQATVPKAGIDAAPNQVVGTMSVALVRHRKARAAIAKATGGAA